MSRPLRLLAAVLAALSFAWLVVVLRWSLWPLDPQLNNAVGLTSGQDFASFHAAGALARAGRAADAYDFALLRAAMAGVIGERASVFFMPWAYPPTFQLVLAPLAMLRPDRALLVWAALMASAAALAGWLIGRRWWIAAIAVIHPAFALALVYGQNGPLTALLLAAGFVAADRAPARAGVAWGLLGFKPHLAFAALALAATRGRWRTLAAAAATAAAVALVALLALGAEPWLAFLEAAPRQGRLLLAGGLERHRAVTPLALALTFGLPAAAAIAAAALAGVAAFAALVAVWRASAEAYPRVLALVCATFLCVPYAFEYDLVALILPLAALLARVERGVAAGDFLVVAGLGLVPPLLPFGAAATGLALAPLALAAGLAWAFRAARAPASAALAA